MFTFLPGIFLVQFSGPFYLSTDKKGKVFTAKTKKALAEGISIGEARGIEKGVEKTAINMLKQKLDDKLICSVTGLSLEEITKLKNRISS